jgi:DNA (cytosine-5)-methyltransferase 1
MNGEKLREYRETLGLSQGKLAELSSIPQHLLSSFELGKQELTKELILKIKKTLSNEKKLRVVINRDKRVTQHEYSEVKILPNRKAKSKKSYLNEEYRNLLSQLEKKSLEKNKKLTAVSLFAGCGGFSLGFSAAGYSIKGFVELQKSLRDIYKQNFPDSFEIGSDITKVPNEKIFEFKKSAGSIDVIIGGPPCQGFSLAGKRDTKDPRNKLFLHYLRFVEILRPKIAIMENVRVLTSMKDENGKSVKDEIQLEFKNRGYKVDYFEVNAKDYGVPQHRERVFFIAVLEDLKIAPAIPSTSHGKLGDLFSKASPHRTFADACSDLPFIESGGSSQDTLHVAVKHPKHVIDWLWDVPEGKSAHDNEDLQKRPPSGYNTTYKRQVWTQPASTVQTTFGMISGSNNVHPIATRSLTIREAARIQSFPDNYKFIGTLGAIRTGIGNAVPPLLAYNLAIFFKNSL